MNSPDQRVLYKLFVKLENGEQMLLAVMEDLAMTRRLVQSLNVHWPGEYTVQDSLTGQAIDLE